MNNPDPKKRGGGKEKYYKEEGFDGVIHREWQLFYKADENDNFE
jgi:hypothetical protein